MLYLVGLGLGDEKDITVRGLEVVRSCDVIYLEAYTSVLGGALFFIFLFFLPSAVILCGCIRKGSCGSGSCIELWLSYSQSLMNIWRGL